MCMVITPTRLIAHRRSICYTLGYNEGGIAHTTHHGTRAGIPMDTVTNTSSSPLPNRGAWLERTPACALPVYRCILCIAPHNMSR